MKKSVTRTVWVAVLPCAVLGMPTCRLLPAPNLKNKWSGITTYRTLRQTCILSTEWSFPKLVIKFPFTSSRITHSQIELHPTVPLPSCPEAGIQLLNFQRLHSVRKCTGGKYALTWTAELGKMNKAENTGQFTKGLVCDSTVCKVCPGKAGNLKLM